MVLTRRGFVCTAALAGVGVRAGFARWPAAAAGFSRRVTEGELRGELAGGLQIFRGVPFAQPPLGALRFRAPRAPLPYAAGRDATSFAPAPVQGKEAAFAQSEDCLYLNLWAPAAGGPYPVFVWIHGGGFTGGRASEAQYDGSHFAGSGVVCITVEYRLGVLGFLDVSPLLGDSYKGIANNGLHDVVAALAWIQRNVAAFGGDPGRVTVGGESAGAKLTDLLLGVPAAEPLFHQAISESGGAERIATAAGAGEVGRAFGAVWTSTTNLPVSALSTAPAQQIVEVQQRFLRGFPEHFPLRPELDESFVPEAPLVAIGGGAVRGKRLLVGTNRDESALFLGPHPQRPVAARDIGNLPLPAFELLAAKYRALYPGMDDGQRSIRSVTAEEYWIPSLRVAEAATAGGAEAFVYRLDFPGTGRFAGLAYHSYDVRFVWQSFDREGGKEAASAPALQLAGQMHAAWVAFIAGRAPGGAGLPVWPVYTLDSRPTMILDQPSRIELDPGGAERRLWDGLLEG